MTGGLKSNPIDSEHENMNNLLSEEHPMTGDVDF
jgi:hypothetical protein